MKEDEILRLALELECHGHSPQDAVFEGGFQRTSGNCASFYTARSGCFSKVNRMPLNHFGILAQLIIVLDGFLPFQRPKLTQAGPDPTCPAQVGSKRPSVPVP